MRKVGNGIKIVLAAICLIGGFGNIGENNGAAIFGIVLGLAFIAWVFVPIMRLRNRKNNRNHLEESAQMAASKLSPEQLVNQPESEKHEYNINTETLAKSLASKIIIEVDGYREDNSDAGLITTFPLNDSQAIKISEYIVLDIETTGLNRDFDKIIEIAWVKYKDTHEIQHYHSLVNPEQHIPDSASNINGITDNDVKDAPTYSEIKKIIASDILGNTIVGHNIASFDLIFIKNLLSGESGELNYIDTLKLAKHAFPGLKSYSLKNLCNSLKLPISSSHHALDDVLATNELFIRCQSEIAKKMEAERRQRKLEKERIAAERATKYANSPLLNIVFVFTGDFENNRQQLESLVNSVGALKRDGVSRNTDYLVVGKIDNLPEWALKRKYGRAKELQSEGKKVQLISEQEYLKLIKIAIENLKLHCN
jgi:DNA polymerase III epsilon subunit family exonuclease